MKVVIGMEMQIPYEDKRAFNSFLNFMGDYQPDKLVMIGDFLDVPGPSRWNRGTAMEYAGTLQRECDKAVGYLGQLREVYDGWIGYHTLANHEIRIENYVRTKAPAFASLEGLRIKNLLHLDELEIEELPAFYSPLPGMLTTHGDRGTLSKYGGGTAIAAARNKGLSVVCGHTHRHGIIYERFGSKTIWGMETGHGMDPKKATYIKSENPNWSAGWGVVETDSKKNLWPSIVTYRNGEVQFGGSHG